MTLHKNRRRIASLRPRVAVAIIAVTALVAVAGQSIDDEPPPPLPDPFPIQRILALSDRLSAELERLGKGVRVRLSRIEFEENVQRAARAARLRANPPRLIQATYRASLRGNDLAGAGQWLILNSSEAAGLLTLHPLNLALQRTRIQHGSAPVADAVIGTVDENACKLLVQNPGESAVWFDWSLRGDVDGNEQRFCFQSAPAPAASLELDIPADHVLAVGSDGCLVSGPAVSSAADRRLWRLEFPGHATVEFVVRPSPAPGHTSPLVIAEAHAKYDIHPDSVESVFEFQLDVGSPGVQELTFDHDADLRPIGVDASSGNVQWAAMPGNDDKPLSRLQVTLSDPLRSGTITVRCLSPLRAEQRWQCPECRVVGAIARKEFLHLRVADGVQLEEWDGGDFQFVRTAEEEANKGFIALERRTIVEGRAPRRPNAVIRGRRDDSGAVHVEPRPLGETPPRREGVQNSPPSQNGREVCIENPRLFSRIDADDRVLHAYEFETIGGHERSVAVGLPAEAEPMSAHVDARRVSKLPMRRWESGTEVILPNRGDGARHRYEIVYATPMPGWWAWTSLQVVVPTHESVITDCRHTWLIPAAIAVVWSPNYRHIEPEPVRDTVASSPSLAQGASQWQGDNTEQAPIYVARHGLIPLFAMVLALCVVCVAWMIRHTSMRFRLMLAAVGFSIGFIGVAVMPYSLLPIWVWPLLAIIGVFAHWGAQAIPRSRRARALAPITTCVGIVVVLVGPIAGQMAGPPVPTVLIVPGETDQLAHQTVLVEPSVLDRLDRMARRATSPVSSPMVTSANYDGTIGERHADIRAVYRIVQPSAKKATLVLPLAGIQINEALLDGAPAVVTHRPPIIPRLPESYTVEIAGEGVHHLSLGFIAPLSMRGDMTELRFTVPPVIQSHLAMVLPTDCQFAHSVGQGGISSVTGGVHSLNGVPRGGRLEADLGSVNRVHLRWRVEAAPQTPTDIRVHEAYLWTLRSESVTLDALLNYSIKGRATGELRVEVPETLEIRSLSVDRVSNDTSDGMRPQVRDWAVSNGGGKRILAVRFLRPINGAVRLAFHAMPRQPIGHRAALNVPLPHGITTNGDDGFVAYRTENVAAEMDPEHSGIVPADPRAFLDLWKAARLPAPGPDLHVYRFRRGIEPPILPLTLQPKRDQSRASETVRWTIGSQRSELDVTTAVEAPDGDLCLLEWKLSPRINIAEVTGHGVRGWSRSGDRLQVWLQRTVEKSEVTLSGSITDEIAGVFQLPLVRLVSVPQVTINVKLAVPSGHRIVAAELSHLRPGPGSHTAPETLDLVTDHAEYSGRFIIHSEGTQPAKPIR